METLQITKENVLKAHTEGSSDVKKALENLFGKDVFVTKNIMERVKTYEDACAVLGIDPNDSLPFKKPSGGDEKSINAYHKLIIIARALNEGWKPDWSNYSQYKYVPWFEHRSGFGLSDFDYDDWSSVAGVGSRLCFKSAELAKYAGKQFDDIYRDYLTLE